jgi:hypothetical protein
MWVRGWYWPAPCRSATARAGQARTGHGPSSAARRSDLGRGRAGLPGPAQALGFFGHHGSAFSFFKSGAARTAVAAGMPSRPVAQAGFGVDVARTGRNRRIPRPRRGKLLRAFEAAIRVVMAAQQDAGERQALQHDGRPAFERCARSSSRCGVARRHQQRTPTRCRVARVRRPGRHQQTAQAVGSQHHVGPARANTASSSCAIQSPRRGRIQSCCSPAGSRAATPSGFASGRGRSSASRAG